jgi:hypothetical protein
MPTRQLSDGNDSGTVLGQSAADLVGFYGLSTAISQRALAAQATSLLASSTDFTSVHLAALVEVMNTLAALGLWKGSA